MATTSDDSTVKLGQLKTFKDNLMGVVATDSSVNAAMSELAKELKYTLPAATASTLGGIKVGPGLTVKSDGTLSSSVSVPTAPSLAGSGLAADGNTLMVARGAGLSLDSNNRVAVDLTPTRTSTSGNVATLVKDTTIDSSGLYGLGVSLNPNGAQGLKITASGNNHYLDTAAATTSTMGMMSVADKIKLNGIEENANKYTLPAATESALGGVFLTSDAALLNQGIEGFAVGAGAYKTIKSQVETNTNNIAKEITDRQGSYASLKKSIESVEASVEGKQDAITAGTGLSKSRNTLSLKTADTNQLGGIVSIDPEALNINAICVPVQTAKRKSKWPAGAASVLIEAPGLIVDDSTSAATFNNATQTTGGMMSAADKTKLDGIDTTSSSTSLTVATGVTGASSIEAKMSQFGKHVHVDVTLVLSAQTLSQGVHSYSITSTAQIPRSATKMNVIGPVSIVGYPQDGVDGFITPTVKASDMNPKLNISLSFSTTKSITLTKSMTMYGSLDYIAV